VVSFENSPLDKFAKATTFPRLLVVGDADVPTGFARVIRSIFGPLSQAYEIHQLGISYDGDPHAYNWPLYPARVGGDEFGRARVAKLVTWLKPALVFILNDIWLISDYVRLIRDVDPAVKIIAYCPIETGPVDATWIERLTGIDRIVTYTAWAKRELERARLPAAGSSASPVPIEVIPHGVDTSAFHPIDCRPEIARAKARRLLFGTDPDFDNAFIVLNANRNQPRKRIDTTIRGFAMFAKEKPANVRLYLHMALADLGWNIGKLTQRYGLDSRLIVTTDSGAFPNVTDEQLNLIYNACDVGLNTAVSEGWGLVAFEHAATRAPQVVPGHGCTLELWDGAAEFLCPAMSMVAPVTLLEEHFITPEEVAKKLDLLYCDKDRRARLADLAYQRATRDELAWDSIVQCWDTLIGNLLATSSGK
jgi:glycosyltransferase involved in cell wall biosynthesis